MRFPVAMIRIVVVIMSSLTTPTRRKNLISRLCDGPRDEDHDITRFVTCGYVNIHVMYVLICDDDFVLCDGFALYTCALISWR